MKNKGVTLIALVITIIILIILASISISLILGNDGIFHQANQAREITTINSYKEKIDLILTEEKMKQYTENKPMTITSLVERFNNESFVGKVERIDLEQTENKGVIRIITTDGYIYEVTMEEEKNYTVSQGKDDGEPYPTISLEVLPLQGMKNEKIQIKININIK